MAELLNHNQAIHLKVSEAKQILKAVAEAAFINCEVGLLKKIYKSLKEEASVTLYSLLVL